MRPPVSLPDVVDLLRLHREEWDDGSVRELEVFGSFARGAAGPESDVDFLLSFTRPVGLLHLVRFKLVFEELLGRRVDVVTPGGLKAALRAEVLEDALSVTRFEAPRDGGPRPKRWRWRVRDMVAALERVARFTADLDEAAFHASELVQDAVLLNLLRVGESVSYLPDELRLLHPEVPWERLRQVRHLVAHDYFGLDLSLVWTTVREELPPVTAALREVAERRRV
ncbi:HepT-like ribonuclease domain-containing protein [Deinococcus pimensis]|uniref:HepT-like ribonuclease domain-containing protein n=1 Tax=Deinococcus pimensis TaxID=309888 RepID=UPI0012F77B83|nr:HepT-like ribonuclease domain-containing protein [Deinococcus pimensis]